MGIQHSVGHNLSFCCFCVVVILFVGVLSICILVQLLPCLYSGYVLLWYAIIVLILFSLVVHVYFELWYIMLISTCDMSGEKLMEATVVESASVRWL